MVEEGLNLRKQILCLTVGREPQPVLLAPAMVPIGTTDGGGGRVPKADGVMVQGLVGLPTEMALALVQVQVLVQVQAQVLAMGLGVVALEMVDMVLELVLGALEMVALVEEVAAQVATSIPHHESLGTKRTIAECTGLMLHGSYIYILYGV